MNNNVKTAVLLAGLGGVCMFIGQLLGGTSGLVIGLLIGLGMAGGSYWFTDKLAIRSAKAVEVSAQQMPQYHAIVGDLAMRAGLPSPGCTSARTRSPTPSPPAATPTTQRCA